MYQILNKQKLAPKIFLYEILAPEIAANAKPGQFVIIRSEQHGERIPLTIYDFHPEKGSIKIVFQEVGFSTRLLGHLDKGDVVTDVAGPLGRPSEIKNFGRVILIGGGVGAAPVYPIARALKAAGNTVISIIGARSDSILILRQEMSSVSHKLLVCTEDGSAGEKGFVTDLLQRELNKPDSMPDLVIAIGPLPMMKAVSQMTSTFPVKTTVSLNPIMVDGTGMCGACRVKLGGQTMFACVDGPEFDAHEVDWDALLRRSRMYHKEEHLALQREPEVNSENSLDNCSCSGGGCQCR